MSNTEFQIKTLNDDSREISAGTVLDNSNADSFSALLMELYESKVTTVLINMSELEFLSSAGVGAILGTVELFRENKGDIVLAEVGDKILHILEVLNLDDYLTVCKSHGEARAKCGVR